MSQKTKNRITFLTDVDLPPEPEFVRHLSTEFHTKAVLKETGIRPGTARNEWSVDWRDTDREQRKLDAEQRQRKMQLAYEKEQAKKAMEREKQAEAMTKQWSKQQDRIIFKPPSQNYYTDLPIQPGFGFYKNLVHAKRVPISKLKINIPETLYIGKRMTWIHNKGNAQGFELKEFKAADYHKTMQQLMPSKDRAVVVRFPLETDANLKCVPLTWHDFSDKIIRSQIPSTGLLQQFIQFHSERPTVTRVFYKNNTMENKTSYAEVIVATRKAITQYVPGDKILLKFKHDGFELYHQSGKSIAEFEAVCAKVIKFLHSNYPVKIDEIVLDFIKDRNGELWLIGCKGFRLDEHVLAARQLKINPHWELRHGQKKVDVIHKKEEILTRLKCSACLLTWKSDEVDQIVPMKLLNIYKMHTQLSNRRHVNLAHMVHIRWANQEHLSQIARVWSLWYMLILQEYELYMCEMKIGEILNIPVQPLNLLSDEVFTHPAYMPAKITQWRILLFFDSIQLEPDNDFISKMSDSFTVNYNFLTQPITHSIPVFAPSFTKRIMNYSKMFYLFSERDRDVKDILHDEQLEFKFRNWSGEWRLFKVFTFSMGENSGVWQTHRIILFDADGNKVGEMTVIAGVAKDEQRATEGLPYNIEKYQTIYIPEESYHTTDPFPDIWLEIYDKDYNFKMQESMLDSSQELEKAYDHILPNDEFVSKTYGSTKVMHINKELWADNKFMKTYDSIKSIVKQEHNIQRQTSLRGLKTQKEEGRKSSTSFNSTSPSFTTLRSQGRLLSASRLAGLDTIYQSENLHRQTTNSLLRIATSPIGEDGQKSSKSLRTNHTITTGISPLSSKRTKKEQVMDVDSEKNENYQEINTDAISTISTDVQEYLNSRCISPNTVKLLQKFSPRFQDQDTGMQTERTLNPKPKLKRLKKSKSIKRVRKSKTPSRYNNKMHNVADHYNWYLEVVKLRQAKTPKAARTVKL